MEIKIFTKIDDPELASSWQRIVDEYDYFPQSSYGWCVPWWNMRSGSRQLHIVAVVDDQKIVGIAPLCIERFGLFKILRSFPIHFGDFYHFIIANLEPEKYHEIGEHLVHYLRSFKDWDLVKIEQVNDASLLHGLLSEEGFIFKKLTAVIATEFAGITFEEYLQKFSSKRRTEYKRRKKRLQAIGKIEILSINSFEEYLTYVDDMKKIFSSRWATYEKYYQCRNEAISSCFDRNEAVLFLLKLEGEAIAFFLGFLHGHVFYKWRQAYMPEYSKLSPSIFLHFSVIEHLINNGYKGLNNMAGEYFYKRSWVPESIETTNYVCMLANNSIKGHLLLNYYLEWRDYLKNWYHKIKSMIRKSK